MNCPRCTGNVLEERERDGVTVDGCRTCRGIWLDRGELERLIARATSDFDDLERVARPDRDVRADRPPASDRAWKRRDDDDDDRDDGRRDGRYPQRRRRWFEALGDIFD